MGYMEFVSMHSHRLLVRQWNLARWMVAQDSAGKYGLMPVNLLHHLLGVSDERVRQIRAEGRVGIIPAAKVLSAGPDWCDVGQVVTALAEWDAGRYLMSHQNPGEFKDVRRAILQARGLA